MRRSPISRPGAPVYWPALLPEHAAAAWEELRAWVQDVVDRFGLDARTIPPCWFRHNAVVEALAALRDHERACFEYATSPAMGVEWLRGLREVEMLLREWVSRTGCTAGEHRDAIAPRHAVDSAEWGSHVADDTARRRALCDGEDVDFE